ncbi:hypothetical protein OROMI_017782 [Orobanche minor]
MRAEVLGRCAPSAMATDGPRLAAAVIPATTAAEIAVNGHSDGGSRRSSDFRQLEELEGLKVFGLDSGYNIDQRKIKTR